MNKTEIKAQTPDVVIAKYENYKQNEVLGWEEWVSYLLDYLENFIKYRIRERHATLGAEFEDLMQQGRMAIIEHAKEFDPRRAQASTYFIRYIDQRIKESTDTKCMNKYYLGIACKLEKVAKDYNYTGLDDPNLTLHDLQILSGESIKTIKETFDLMNMQLVSFEAVSENIDLPSLYDNPETSYIKKERSDFLKKEFSKLTPLEQMLVANSISNKPLSYKKLVKELSTEEKRIQFEDELPKTIDQKFLEQTVFNALSKIKHTKAFSQLTDRTFRKPYDEPEELVSAEYLENALLCDSNFFDN